MEYPAINDDAVHFHLPGSIHSAAIVCQFLSLILILITPSALLPVHSGSL
ncbi:MAG: hypothetical protein ACI9LG_001733 [Moritella dasanensis]|jgi:hypothetical protein